MQIIYSGLMYFCIVWTEQDKQFMQRALELAALGIGSVAPNPMVGAVIVHNQKIIGEGFHRAYGGPHAEVHAINAVEDKSVLPNATMFVTLEPCAHFGKTPPCADLLVAHKVGRVVVAGIDPFAEVAGKGIARMRKANIIVDVGLLRSQADALNFTFFHFHKYKKPFITLKWAETANGKMAKINGQKNWISGTKVGIINHQLRASCQAILVGFNTAITDNPKLDVRHVAGKNPMRIVFDKNGSLPEKLHLLSDLQPTMVVCETMPKITVEHVNYFLLSATDKTQQLQQIVNELYKMGILHLVVEGGAKTLNQFLDAQLLDEIWQIRSKEVFWTDGIDAPKVNLPLVERLDFETDWLLRYLK